MSGKSMVIDPLGKILAKASPTEDEIITAEFEREAVVQARQRFPLARDRRPDAYGAIVRATEELHS
jgi:N-carbamoylputrescine amidase